LLNFSAIAQCAEVLARVEAEAAAEPQRARVALAVAGAVGLGRVLDHRDTVPPADLKERLQVGRLPVEVDRQDRPGAGGDGFLDLPDVHRVGGRVHVHVHRGRSGVADGP